LSTGTPDAPGTPDATPNASAASGDKPSGKYWAITAGIAVVLGVAGFFIGSAVKQSDYDKGKSGYNKIYAEGQAAGNAAGKAAGQKLGVAQGLQVGKKAGEIAGQKAGEAAGQKAGYSAGYTAGVQKGSLATLGGLTGWNTNVPYVVELDPSPIAGVPYQIYSRTLMKADVSYYLCPNGTTVCSNPLVK
jgi:hypothetical protein